MISVFTEPITSERAKITRIHFRPDLLTAEQKSNAIMVDAIPTEPERIKGKAIVLFINPNTKEMWYEYEDRALNQEEHLEDISKKLTELIEITKGK